MINEEKIDYVIDKNKYYLRNYGDEYYEVCDEYSQLNNAKKSYIVPSGLNSIYLILSSVCEKISGKTFLYSNEIYFCTEHKVLNFLKNKFTNIVFKEFDPITYNPNNYKKDEVGCLFIESASNPSGKMLNWELLEVNKPEYVIVDNTWLSPFLFKPFLYNVDIIIESGSKYLSSGKCIVGLISFKKESILQKEISDLINIMGLHVSPLYVNMLREGIKNLENIMNILFEKTMKVINKLKNDYYIVYPLLETHSCFDIYKKYCSEKGPDVFIINVKTNKSHSKIKKIIKDSEICFATSYGK